MSRIPSLSSNKSLSTISLQSSSTFSIGSFNIALSNPLVIASFPTKPKTRLKV